MKPSNQIRMYESYGESNPTLRRYADKAEQLEQILESVPRQGPMMLDNLGIHINMSTLPSADLYSIVREIRFGSGFLGELYAQNIRQFIAPKKHERICHAWHQVRIIWKQELLNAILEKGEVKDATATDAQN